MTLKSKDDQILHRALDSRLLKALEFANIAAELATLDVPADEYLVLKGIITKEQRDQLVASLTQDGDEDHDLTQNDVSPSKATASGPSSPSNPPAPAGLSSRNKPSRSREEPTSDSRYEWQEKFAQGGLGAVWRAHDLSLDRGVALKEILPKASQDSATVERFLEEARITGQLQHPGVVPIYDMGTAPSGSPYYIMRFVEGKTLHDEIKTHFTEPRNRQSQDSSQRQLLSAFVRVCRTMQYAHDKGYIHRDLKPRNIMLGDYGETLVVDWGLAMSVASKLSKTVDLRTGSGPSTGSKRQSVRSKSRHVVGTPAYLAPEQARGEIEKMDARSDIYSLGSVLFEILTGKPPYTGEDSGSIISEVARGEFVEPRGRVNGIPPALNSICLKAMQFEKKHRYQSAGELADDIERYLAGDRVEVHEENLVERGQRILAKNSKVAVVALCGLLVLCCVIGTAAFLINNARHAERTARLAAVEAREAEVLALQKAETAKGQAIDNLRSAVDAVDTWLLQLSADLEFYPGLAGKRVEFLEQAATYYDRLSQPITNDVALGSEIAKAAIRSGDVQQLLGHLDSALPKHEAAIRWFRLQSADDPEHLGYKRELANALIGSGIVATKDGDASQSKKALMEAQELLRGLAIIDANDAKVQQALARLSVAQARNEQAQSNFELALGHLEDARRRLIDIVAKQDAPARYVALYHSTLFELVDLYVDANDFELADQIASEAIRSYDHAIQQAPGRPDHYDGRMTAWIMRGNIHELTGRDENALNFYSAARTDHVKLVDVLHRGEYHSENLVAAMVNQARIHLRHGSTAEATALLDHCRNEISTMIQTRGQQLPLLRLFSITVFLSAEAEVALSNYEDASEGFSEVKMVMEHLVAQQPDEAMQYRLAKTNRELAKLAAMRQDFEQASSYVQSAENAASSLQGDDRGKLELALCNDLIRVAKGIRQNPDAITSYKAFLANQPPASIAELQPLWNQLVEATQGLATASSNSPDPE